MQMQYEFMKKVFVCSSSKIYNQQEEDLELLEQNNTRENPENVYDNFHKQNNQQNNQRGNEHLASYI